VKDRTCAFGILAATVTLANVLWFISFYLEWSVFWYKIGGSAALLAGVSMLFQPESERNLRFNTRTVFIGLASAAVLYGIFWVGKTVSTAILPFGARQIGEIYDKGTGTPPLVIMLLLCFVTGPAEEIYWRGFLQKNLMRRFGKFKGWALATAVYSAVHIWSFNFMLIGAAAVAGAFWGALYWRFKDLSPAIVSHAVWSAVIFAVYPIR
jgi:uncharacterized protein